jgi:hypothetical protein
MNFTEYEQSVIRELEKRAGDVLYIKDIAPFFIFNSYLQISTYTQTAYIQVGANMQKALSEYFQLVVFIKKMENNGVCFSIPYTPLEDNSVQIGNHDFEEYQQHTIADADLLIQLFHFAGKKFVIAPNNSHQFYKKPKQSNLNLIIPTAILLLLFLFIGGVGYLSFEDHKELKGKQEVINGEIKEHSETIGLLSTQIQNSKEQQEDIENALEREVKLINNSLESQSRSLKSVRYWSRKQHDQLLLLIDIARQDSLK